MSRRCQRDPKGAAFQLGWVDAQDLRVRRLGITHGSGCPRVTDYLQVPVETNHSVALLCERVGVQHKKNVFFTLLVLINLSKIPLPRISVGRLNILACPHAFFSVQETKLSLTVLAY